MKQKNVLLKASHNLSRGCGLLTCLLLLLPLPAKAQRDYSLTESSNVWLSSHNAAALTTFADSSISRATVSYGYKGGRYRGVSDGSNEMSLTADARSYYSLSDKVTGYGSVTYTNFSGTDMSGSMFSSLPLRSSCRGSLLPFDILQSDDDAGRKHEQLFNVAGGIGWNVWRGLSIGAKAGFSAGSYAKYKDLRHSNTLMSLYTEASLFYTFRICPSDKGLTSSLGASFLYDRSTETVKFKTYGTTDHVYQVLLDYASRCGEILTYGGDGFIDDNTELPLFDERCGFSVQGSINHKPSTLNLYAEFTCLHRNGYYGKQTQYTASYEQHSGNSYGWRIRLDLPTRHSARHTPPFIHWLDLDFNSEGITTYKTNYRQVKSADNTSVTYYEYYTPTKMSNKILNSLSVAYTLYLTPLRQADDITHSAMYLWKFNAGAYYLSSRQTAYLYPEMNTRKATLLTPFVHGKRNIPLRGTQILGIELGMSAQCGNMDILMDGIGRQIKESLGISYEFPMLHIRPGISLNYSCAQSNDAAYSRTYRHNIIFSIGAMF